MIEKNRGNEVILEMVEALKNKNFEFPRADSKHRGRYRQMQNKKENIKWYIALQVIYFIYACSSLFGKKAGEYPVFSFSFLVRYAGVLSCMLIYAAIWQQVIRHLPLIMAYVSRAVTVLWGVVLGMFFYKEKISLRQTFALFLIMAGIVLFASSDHNPPEAEND